MTEKYNQQQVLYNFFSLLSAKLAWYVFIQPQWLMYPNHHYRVHWFISKNIFCLKKHIYLCQKIEIARYKRVVNKLINNLWLLITCTVITIRKQPLQKLRRNNSTNIKLTPALTRHVVWQYNSFHIGFLMSSASLVYKNSGEKKLQFPCRYPHIINPLTPNDL
jgi:hypothetical protein